jgi:predicted MFS family arabinose efflux permease
MSDLGVSEADIGWMMSLFNFSGLILALPCGFICAKYGIKNTILVAIATVIVGSSMGALAQDVTLLNASRFVEGIGMGLVSVAAPAGIVPWFKPEKRGLPLGVWTFWMPLSTLILFNTAPALSGIFGWRFVFWAVSGFSIIAFILFATLFKLPGDEQVDVVKSSNGDVRAILQIMKGRNIWLIGLAFCFFNLATPGVIGSFYPTYLELQGGFTNAEASSLTSIITVFGLISPAIGYLCDKTGRPKVVMLSANIAIGILMLFVFQVTSLVGVVLVTGLAGILIPAVTAPARLIATHVTGGSAAQASVSMAVLAFFQNLGAVIGPALFGMLLLSMSWVSAGLAILIPTMLLTLICTLLVKIRKVETQ